MCIFTHFAAGAFVGSFAPYPVVAPLLGLGSHILLDVLPHYDFESMKLEIIFGFVALAVLLSGGVFSFVVIAGGLAGVLPDLENLLWKTGVIGENRKIFPGHRGFIQHGPRAGFVNLGLQVAASAAVLFFLVWRNP